MAPLQGRELTRVEGEVSEIVDGRGRAQLAGHAQIGRLAKPLHVPDPAHEPFPVVGNPDRADDGDLPPLGREGLDHDLAPAQLADLGRRESEPLDQRPLHVERLGSGDPGTRRQDDAPHTRSKPQRVRITDLRTAPSIPGAERRIPGDRVRTLQEPGAYGQRIVIPPATWIVSMSNSVLWPPGFVLNYV